MEQLSPRIPTKTRHNQINKYIKKKNSEGPLNEDLSQKSLFKTRKSGSKRVRAEMACGLNFRDQASGKQRVRPGPEGEVKHDRMID